ncbi:hypothetical protein KRX54_05540 [Actinomycetaceae bacterium TAE3-ERU4]|nr:hypothetical protein [Actinomycetaceae bacterium TAE3-ERU4]
MAKEKNVLIIPQSEIVRELDALLGDLGLLVEKFSILGRSNPTLVVDVDLLDGPGSVTGSQLESATRLVSQKLDELDPVKCPYTLEVGTAGACRELTTPRLWRRTLGLPVSLKLTSRKRVNGVLKAVDEENVTVTIEGKDLQVALKSIETARSRVDISNMEE